MYELESKKATWLCISTKNSLIIWQSYLWEGNNALLAMLKLSVTMGTDSNWRALAWQASAYLFDMSAVSQVVLLESDRQSSTLTTERAPGFALIACMKTWRPQSLQHEPSTFWVSRSTSFACARSRNSALVSLSCEGFVCSGLDKAERVSSASQHEPRRGYRLLQTSSDGSKKHRHGGRRHRGRWARGQGGAAERGPSPARERAPQEARTRSTAQHWRTFCTMEGFATHHLATDTHPPCR